MAAGTTGPRDCTPRGPIADRLPATRLPDGCDTEGPFTGPTGSDGVTPQDIAAQAAAQLTPKLGADRRQVSDGYDTQGSPWKPGDITPGDIAARYIAKHGPLIPTRPDNGPIDPQGVGTYDDIYRRFAAAVTAGLVDRLTRHVLAQDMCFDCAALASGLVPLAVGMGPVPAARLRADFHTHARRAVIEACAALEPQQATS